MSIVPALILSVSGIAVAAVAFNHRTDPAWRRGMAWIMGIAITQVVLGALSALLIR
jgi:hypothetical protein